MTSYLFSRWMDHFIEQLQTSDLGPTNRHLILLNGHKSHVTLEVIQKAKENGIDMITLSSTHFMHCNLLMWLASSHSRMQSMPTKING